MQIRHLWPALVPLALFLTKALERLRLARFVRREAIVYLALMLDCAQQGHFLLLELEFLLRARRVLPVSFASRDAAVQLAQAFVLLAATLLLVQA